MRVVLASKSPRRKELLGRIIKDFDIMTREVDETLPAGVHPSVGVEMLSIRKGEALLPMVDEDTMVISSDTLVELDGVALGKPRDREDAHKMLRSLSARVHNVHTGVAVHYRGKCYSGTQTSHVKFREMSDEEIYSYIDTGEPMDKAGSYGIQGLGGKFVVEFDGEFEGIMGLSVVLTQRLVDAALLGE